MSFFSKIFGGGQTSKLAWNIIQSEDDINEIIEKSKIEKCVIFKHSTRCSISSMALSRFENGWDEHNTQNLYFLDLIQFRPISNAIAEKFHVKHESPQVLVIENGEVLYHSSHNAIDPKIIAQQ